LQASIPDIVSHPVRLMLLMLHAILIQLELPSDRALPLATSSSGCSLQ
jgi:hypothetical protein